MRHWVDIDIHIKINQRNIRASFFRFCLTNNIFWIGFDENGSKIVWFDQDSNFIEFFNRTQKLWTSRLRQLCRPQWLRRLLLKRCEAPTMREKKLKTNWAWMWMKNIFYNITLKIKKNVTWSTGRSPGPAGPQHFGSTLTWTSTFVFASTSNRDFAAEEPGTASSAAIGSGAFGTPHVGHSIPRNPRFAGPWISFTRLT